MRVFLDSNVWVAAMHKDGPVKTLVRYLIGEHEIVASEFVIIEILKMLRRELRLANPELDKVENVVRRCAEVVKVELGRPFGPIKEPEDLQITYGAISGECKVLITLGKAILQFAGPMSVVGHMNVMTPAEFKTWQDASFN